MTSTSIDNSTAVTAAAASAPSSHRRTARSVGAVFAGLLTIFAITTATDLVLHAAGIYPTPGVIMSHGLFVLAAAYRVLYGVLGCYVAARLAPERPLTHALALGWVGTLISTLGAVVMWHAGPAWYSLAVIAMALPCAWAGGTLRVAQLAQRGTPR